MEKFVQRPNIDLYPGIRVTKETQITFQNENVRQTLKDLKLHSVLQVKGEGYHSTYDTTIELQEGDVLIFEDEGRGYIKPVEAFVSVQEAMEELACVREG